MMGKDHAARMFWVLMFLLALVPLTVFWACHDNNNKNNNPATDDDTAADDDSPDDDVADDDAADDDAADDDAVPPTMPNNHDVTWDCYVCHETAFNGATAEPHSHLYTAPDQCVGCHVMGNWLNTPSGAAAHNVTLDCLTCHPDHHSKTWQSKTECRVCHQ